MKKIELYMCEYCHTQYADIDEAMKCEQNHKKIKEITETRYSSIASDATGYPDSITVVFSDGCERIYYN